MKWKKIQGYDKYSISDTGYVRNDNTKKILKFNYNGAGYRRACLSKKSIQKYPFIHRLVWETFMGEIPKGLVIDHIDNDKLNNRLDNLQLLKFNDNLKKIYGRKPYHHIRISEDDKREISQHLKNGKSAKWIHENYPISYTYACKVKNEKLWG